MDEQLVGRWLSRQGRQVLSICLAGGLVLLAHVAARALFPPVSGAVLITAAAVAGQTYLAWFVGNTVVRTRSESFRRLEEHGRRLAIYDRETGLLAYWYFSLRVDEEIARARRYDQPFGLLLIEAKRSRLDQEEEQRLVADIREGFRQTDLVCHIGNLRFVVLLASTNVAGVTVVFERFVQLNTICGLEVGHACFPQDGLGLAALLRAAELQARATRSDPVAA